TERLGVFAAEIEDDLPRVDGARRVVELLGREVRELGADLRFLDVARRVLELALVDRVELRPRSLRRVDAREGLDGGVMRLVEAVEDPTERDGRIRDVVEPRLVQLAEA